MSVAIVSVGARGPLGLSSLQLALCVRAAKIEPRALGLLDKRGREIGACVTGGLGATLHGYWRMVALAAPALREALRGAGLLDRRDDRAAPPLPLVLCLPEAGRPDDDRRFGGELAAALGEACAGAIDAARAHVIRCGHAGGAYALETARALLDAGARHVVVGGVDSYYHPGVLGWLDEGCRLHALDAEDGIVPSEGAAFAVLARIAPASEEPRSHAAVRARLLRVATGLEGTVGTDAPNIAATLTRLLHEAVAAHGEPRWALTDVNGERHRVREWGMAALRSLPKDVRHDRLAVQLGDIGAAFGPTLLAIACQLWRRAAAPADSVVVALHSEGPERGVFVLERG